jgi:hypothetical protein
MSSNTQTNYFAELSKINVNEHIERKGQFSYLSWPFAVSQLRQFDPTASWEVKRFDNLPFLKTDLGVFVEVAVTVQGITLSQIHPVLDGKNRPLMEPSAFDINTSIQRCLVKAIALQGLGLYIYSGEDLPESDGQGEVKTIAKPTTPVSVASTVHDFPTRSTATTDQMTQPQIRYIKKLIIETGTCEEQVLRFFSLDALESASKADASRIIKMLESNRKAVA